MHSNRYTFIYAIAISILTAIILATTSVVLKPQQDFNLALDNKANVLKSVLVAANSPNEIEKIYKEQVQEIVINAKGEILPDIKVSSVVLKDELGKKVEDR